MFERRWVSRRPASSPTAIGGTLSSPAAGQWRLCHGPQHHLGDSDLRGRRLRGVPRQGPAPARPRSLCRRVAATGGRPPESGLCELHAQLWTRPGRPRGALSEAWAARVRQPVNSRVLSACVGCLSWCAWSSSTRSAAGPPSRCASSTGGMRPWVDQLRALGCRLGHRVRPRQLRQDRRPSLCALRPLQRRPGPPGLCRSRGRAGQRHLGPASVRRSGGAGSTSAPSASAGCARRPRRGRRPPSAGSATTSWSATVFGRRSVLSAVLASGPGGGEDPARSVAGRHRAVPGPCALARFPTTGQPSGAQGEGGPRRGVRLVLREARELGLLNGLGADVRLPPGRPSAAAERGAARPGPAGWRRRPARRQLELLRGGPWRRPARPGYRHLGVLGEHAGEMAVLVLQAPQGHRPAGRARWPACASSAWTSTSTARTSSSTTTTRPASMGRRLPLADSALVAAVRAQQAWVRTRFPATPRPSCGCCRGRTRTQTAPTISPPA